LFGSFHPYINSMRGRGGGYCMVFGFSTTGIYAISAITTNVVSSNPAQARCTDTTLCNKVCQWLAAGQWFSLVSSSNKTDWNIVESGIKHHYPNTNNQFHDTNLSIIVFLQNFQRGVSMYMDLTKKWVSERLVFNAKWAIIQLYYIENKLYFNDNVCFALDHHA
jgi:hypothetical protein